VIKRAIQVIGLLMGIGGMVVMVGILLPVVPRPGRETYTLDPYIILLAVFIIGYLIFLNYLLWVRFSPRAIRHFCGVIACMLFGVVFVNAGRILDWLGMSQPVFAMVTFFLVVAVYFLGTVLLNLLTGMDASSDEKATTTSPRAKPDRR